MIIREAVLSAIKNQSAISAVALANLLGLKEKTVRSAIDRLRDSGEMIWFDSQSKQFWWRNDIAAGSEMYQRWKRTFIPDSQ